MSKSLGKVTLCIFTTNRHNQLRKLISYYSSFDLQIIVLDASLSPMKFSSNEKVTYVHAPGMPLQNRLIKFSEIVQTEYILLSPDDDYYSLHGIAKTVEFLEKNKNYSSAQGLRIRFFDLERFSWIPDYVDQLNLHYNQDDLELRTLNMAKGMHYIYSVIRLSYYHEVVSCLGEVQTEERNSFAINELIFNYCLPVFGYHRILPVLYQLRRSHLYLGSDVNYASWINNKQNVYANAVKNNVKKLYISKLDIGATKAEEIINHLNYHFSQSKLNPMDRKLKNKIKEEIKLVLIKIKIFGTARKLKVRHYAFYYLLFVNGNFRQAFGDIKYLKNHLRNKLNSDSDSTDTN